MDPRAHWPAYFVAARNFDVRPTTRHALTQFAKEDHAGLAVDLGCGNGTDTRAILEHGWTVLGIDASQEGLRDLIERTPAEQRAHLTLKVARMEEAEIPPCLLINASFALPFCDPDDFDDLWQRLVDALPTGGRLACQLFGTEDSWHVLGYALTHTKPEIDALMQPFDIELCREDKTTGHDALGTSKHWHVWHLVGRKK